MLCYLLILVLFLETIYVKILVKIYTIISSTYLINATPRGLPVILSRKIFFCTIKPYLPNITSNCSSVMDRGKFVTYKFVSLISSPAGRAYETLKKQQFYWKLGFILQTKMESTFTFKRLLRTVTPLRHFKAL